MNRVLDILIISENKEESNFLLLFLKKSGLNIKNLKESDIKHYREELTNNSFTIILLAVDSFKEKAVNQFINIYVNIINIPIVVVSKNNEPEFKTKLLENGAEAFIDIKDINYELFKRELIDAIDRYNYKNRLIHSENSFKLALNSLTSPIVIISEKMSILYVNPAAEIIFKNYYKDIISTTEKIIKSKNDFTEKVNLKIDNRNFIFDISISQIYWLNQKAYLIELYDRTKEAHYLEEIQKEKEILNKVIGSFPGYIYYKDIEGKYLGSNKLFGEEIFGLSNESLITKTDEELIDYASDKRIFEINTTPFKISEEELITKDGSKKDFFTFRKALLDENKNLYSNLTIMLDITAKKIEEREKAKFLTAMNQSLNIIIITDKSGNIEYVNRAFENTTLYTLAEVKYQHISIIYQEDPHSEKIQNLLDVLKSRKNWSGEILTKRKDGQLFYQRINITGIYNEKGDIENYIVVGEDITEQKKIAQEKEELLKKMAEVDKMTAIGELAAGVAHEFNNVLAIINSAVELILLKHATGQYDMPADVVEAISTVQSNVYRGADIASNLMTIAKPQEPNKRAYEITKIIDDVMKVQKKQFEIEKIKVIKRYQENLPMIAVDRSQMYQLFLNLTINARHALHNRDEAQLIINVKQNGNSIEIKFIDNGIGIKEEHLDKIFLPFFTTKGSYATDDSQIKGTGLGLAVSKSIVNAHNGSITVDSKYKEGSTFTITLPIENISNEIYFNDQKQSAVKRTFNSQINIVIVDDEKDLVDNISEYLKSMGYNNIYSFTKGKEALSFLKENNIELIILDIIMPEISGEELYKTIKEMNKQCKIIFSSGNLDKIQSFNYKDNDIVEYIKKPFDFETYPKFCVCLMNLELKIWLISYSQLLIQLRAFLHLPSLR